uniref:Uncharacterized protein n=1 Tax=Oryza brachyantha TaxID=4533 RepID=J3LC20_ORYBR
MSPWSSTVRGPTSRVVRMSATSHVSSLLRRFNNIVVPELAPVVYEFTTEDITIVESGLNSVVLASNTVSSSPRHPPPFRHPVLIVLLSCPHSRYRLASSSVAVALAITERKG